MNQNLTVPPHLRRGDTIGLVAPGYCVEPQQWEHSLDLFHTLGWKVELGESLNLQCGRFAGSDLERSVDMLEMLARPDVRALFFARGGYGCARLLPELMEHAGQLPPKWIVGYSDVTALLTCWNQNLHCQCIHGPMAIDLSSGYQSIPPAWEHLRGILTGKMPAYRIAPHPFNRKGRAVAAITGGNLAVIHSLNGTPYQCRTSGRILLIEEVGESLHNLDRMMNSLRLADQLIDLAGLLVGGMTDMRDTNPTYGQTAYEIIRDYVEPYDFPVAFDFPAGHGALNEPVVMGAVAYMEVDRAGCNVTYGVAPHTAEV